MALSLKEVYYPFPTGIAGPRGRPGKPGTNGTPGVPGINAWKMQFPNGSSSNDLLIPPSITGGLFALNLKYYYLIINF